MTTETRTPPLITADLLPTIATALAARGFPGVQCDVGPSTDPRVNDYPNRQVIFTRAGGAGFAAEGLIDRPAWVVDVAGEQQQPNDAERMALALDSWLCNECGYSQYLFDGLWVVAIGRAGGGPVHAGIDDGDRSHLVCTYIIQVESGL